jgi:hypothetical protein
MFRSERGSGGDNSYSRGSSFALGGAAVAGLLVGVVYALSTSSTQSGALGVMGALAAISLAALALGGIVGFLFGLPKFERAGDTASLITPPASSSTVDAVQVAAQQRARGLINRYVGNTNLERVSDWLTTMLVGVTLVSLGPILGAISDFERFLQATIAAPYAGVVGVGLMLLYAVVGFLTAYIWTGTQYRDALTSLEKQLAGDGGSAPPASPAGPQPGTQTPAPLDRGAAPAVGATGGGTTRA